ncbi:MAG: fasciclin domain-containing protein [Caldilineaceae bacterium]
MSKSYSKRLINALLLAILLVATPISILQAANNSAPAQQTRATKVTGSLPGGEFAKIWLGLEPNQPNASIRVFAEWDQPNAAANGLNFFVLDPVGLGRAQAGTQVSSAAVAGGNPVFQGNDNQMEANFNAFGLTNYTLVVVNDSNIGANFTISVEGATIIDDSDQVVNPDAPVVTEEAPAEGEAADEAAATDEAGAETPADETAAADEAAAETTTDAATDEATSDSTAAEPAAPAAPAAAPNTPQVVRETELEGDLAPDTIHYLGLETSERDATVELEMVVNPSDNSEVLRRTNFFVIPTNELARLSASTRLSDVAIAAGNRVFGGASNERKASFKAVGTGPYTVLVQNTSQDVTVNYALVVDGGVLVDDSNQTKTAQAMVATAVTTDTVETEDAATTTTASATTTTASATTATTSTTTATATREGEPGGTYTVQSGDTLSLIARDIYGNLRLYAQICAFNELPNCDRVEVGDVLNLPTQAQIDALGDSPTPAAQPAAEEDESPSATATPAPAEEAASSTDAAADATDAVSTTVPSGAGDIIDIITGSEDFTQLVAAIDAAGLTDALKGSGPFTLFAPTDAAFSALPAGAVEALLADPGGPLTNILLYHVVPGKLMQAGLTNGLNAQTVDGPTVQFTVNGGAVTVNDANVIVADVEATNGVIHVIDTVLSPPTEEGAAANNTAAASADAAASTDASADAAADAGAADTQGVIDNLPVLTDATDLKSSEQNGNATVEYKSQMTIAEAADFYDAQMTRLGYETQTSVVTAQAATFSFTSDASDIRLSITPDTADETSIIVIITVVGS